MQTLKNSELRYRRLFESAQDGILILDAETGMIEDVNSYLIKMLGYSREEFVKKKLWEVGAFRDIEASKGAFEALQENEFIRYEDLPLKMKDGRLVQVEFVSNVYLVDDEKVIQCNIRDITDRKRAEEKLSESRAQFVGIIDAAMDAIITVDAGQSIIGFNLAAEKMFGYPAGRAIGQPLALLLPERFHAVHTKQFARFGDDGQTKRTMEDIPTLTGVRVNGEEFPVEISISRIEVAGKRLYTAIVRDITDRKHAEEVLHASEERYRLLVETLPDGVVVHSQGRVVFANPACATIIGADRTTDLIGKPVIEFVHPDYRELALQRIQQSQSEGVPVALAEEKFVRLDGITIDVEVSAVPFFYAGKPAMLTVFNDITKRKHAEEALRNAEARYRVLFEQSPYGVLLLEVETGKTVEANDVAHKQLGYTREEFSAMSISDYEVLENAMETANHMQKIILEGSDDFETLHHTKSGEIRNVHVLVKTLPLSDVSLFYAIYQDITERKQVDERIQRQFEHLTALSAIDRVIAANFDLKLSLLEILSHVTKELNVDAADILIFNSSSQMLEYGAERGFRTRAVRKVQVRLGESYAGRAALERRIVQIPDLRNEPDNLLLTSLLAGEDFACYYGVPLITKGEVKGVLEVFHRSVLEPDMDWFDFLDTLAGQAAIAIENSTLFESLQRSNVELSLAYDATIEGWSRALDLRDKETEGHTQRVTEMTAKLARAFGFSKAELVQVRWGSLLHDIGKMGVPDKILQKPGPLTEEEWVVMKKHPSFAYEMLSPIRYLRLALDIPYGHHEKWDGTGYPHGLKGEQIPLVARIFAVVDVWDALSSDRPYRAAWTEEKVREYILAASGTHFDPKVVDLFMQIPK
ncbi:MAG: PAS domain S-box protein [Chloroflexi bacterium]|nr:PAS domain S-box protein [Chloroflexota bacterium]